MKRPLLLLFFLTALGIAVLYPRDYQPDAVFPQGQSYQVTVSGQILSYKYQSTSLSLTLADCQIDHSGRSYQCDKLLVTVTEDTLCADPTSLQAGNRLSVTGSLTSFPPARNPGNFDWRAYYLARHISYQIYADKILVQDPHKSPLRQAILDLQYEMSSCLQQLCPDDPDTAALLNAFLLGDKNLLEEEIQYKYENGGILHILSVSGLHISLLGGAVLALGKKLSLPPWLRGILSAAMALFYWQLCGSGLSSGRAAIMFLCLTAAPLVGRSYDPLSALSLAGIFFLWESPLMLFQAGFQLSFGAVLGIHLICPAFVRKPAPSVRQNGISLTEKRFLGQNLQNRIFSVFSALTASLRFGLGLQLTLLPITLYHFFRYPLYGLLLNLLVLPLATPLFFFGAAGLIAFIGAPRSFIGSCLLLPCRQILALYDRLCRIALSLPGTSALWGRPALPRILCYYGILALFCLWRVSSTKTVSSAHRARPHFPYPTLLTLLLPFLLLPTLLLPLPSSTLSVTFLDVGQGDCAFLQTPQGITVLIDGGSSDVRDLAQYRLIPFLESQGVDHLDYVFLSHTDEDHVNGVTAWLEAGYTIGTAVLPDLAAPLAQESSYQKICSILEEQAIPVIFFHEGMSWQADGLSLTCMAPLATLDAASSSPYSDLNAASLVLLAEYQDIRILFTGDCEGEGEALLLSQLAAQGLTCHILKAGHHGSSHATGEELLQQLQPQAVVVSCGIRNRYGHPHPDMLARVDAQGCSCHITASCGAVNVTIRNGLAKLTTFLPAGPLYYR